MAGIKANPGPYRNQLHLGVFNAGGATHKSTGLADIMFDNKLKVMAVSELTKPGSVSQHMIA